MTGHRFNPEKADLLIDPKREKLISPSQMAEILDIQPHDTIADLGAGNGFFALPFKVRENCFAFTLLIKSFLDPSIKLK
ncbi:hypothetical protein F9802_17395 [Bacillus aerolatus]|uniref:Methyltransferase n=1 Tax=Bacillus aerolatus TaxID=2653354 RepID=A0A6I1FGL2_9BACI|nr:hypothetical protein [Bacillus aerolatus]KAB7704464.1 hypothetical protein F9802_17395 [Bacillus aerolatus]